jgi:Domain of unknown function (DUF4384)
MSRAARLLGPNGAVLGAMMTAVMVFPALAQSQSDPALAQSQSDQDESTSRGVRIIDAPTPPPGTGSAAPVLKLPSFEIPGPPLLTPAAPSSAITVPTLTPPVAVARPAPALTQPVIGAIPPAPALTQPIIGAIPPAPALLSPAPELRPSLQVPAPTPPAAVRPNSTANVGAPVPAAPTLIAPSSAPSLQPPSRPVPYETPSGLPPALNNLADLPKQPDGGVHPTKGDIEALSIGLKIPNPAGLAMQILPGPDIAVGSQVSFQISSKKAGYLILVDVEATGKLVQIYPNPMAFRSPAGVRENSNLLRPGKPLRIPDRENLYSGFDFIASPPSGTAMVIAILSDRPVQMVDLPDVPVSLAGSASAVEYLTKLANGLRIPDANGNGRLEEAHWSFDAKFYAIR